MLGIHFKEIFQARWKSQILDVNTAVHLILSAMVHSGEYNVGGVKNANGSLLIMMHFQI